MLFFEIANSNKAGKILILDAEFKATNHWMGKSD